MNSVGEGSSGMGFEWKARHAVMAYVVGTLSGVVIALGPPAPSGWEVVSSVALALPVGAILLVFVGVIGELLQGLRR